MSYKVIEFNNKDKKRLKQFVNLRWKLYKGDPNFVPQIRVELLGNKLFGFKGLLESNHPYHKHSEVRYFMVFDGNEPVGRISGHVDSIYNSFHEEKTGFFGWFECIDNQEVASILLNKAFEFCKSKGMHQILGPENFSSNHSWGLLIENFDDFPYFDTAYNKKYYAKLIENAGYSKAKDLVGISMPVNSDEISDKLQKRLDRLAKVSEKAMKRSNIRLMTLNKKNLLEGLEYIKYIYRGAWEKNWGFVPLNDEEFDLLVENLKMFSIPKFFTVAFVNEEPAGFIGSMPDMNCMIKMKSNPLLNTQPFRIARLMLKKSQPERFRLMLFGLLSKYRKIGLDSVLYYDSFMKGLKYEGVKDSELSWILEDNILTIRAGESMDGKLYKRWRIYKKTI